MSVFDELKKAGSAAGSVVSEGAARSSKMSQMEIRRVKLRSLQKDVAGAEQEMGALAYDLVQAGELSHPMLSASQARVSDARAALSDLEAEIAALRDEALHGDKPSEEEAETATAPPSPGDETAETSAKASKSDDADAI